MWRKYLDAVKEFRKALSATLMETKGFMTRSNNYKKVQKIG